jgi:integrase
MYSIFYDEVDGSTKRVRQYLGAVQQISVRAARREHDRIMQQVNRRRGSVAPAYKGQTFADALRLWREHVAPNLSPATVRARESAFRLHILPRFASSAPHAMGVQELQQFATELRKSVSRKSIINILSSVFAVFNYAARCGFRVPEVRFKDLELGSPQEPDVPYFTKEQASRIINAAKEPYKTLFATAWYTGLRAGELFALTKGDLDFERKTIRVNKSADDKTREIRQPKTRKSVATLPMPSALEAMLRSYLEHHYKPNLNEILFTNRWGTRSMKRESLVQFVLRPIQKKLGMPLRGGLHAFRHGLATELADASVPVTVLQSQMRHTDVKTTLRIYAHVIPQSQRDAMERMNLSTNGTENQLVQ